MSENSQAQQSVERGKKYVEADMESEMQQYFGRNIVSSFVRSLGGMTVAAMIMFGVNILYIYFPFITDMYENWLPVFNIALVAYLILFIVQQFYERKIVHDGIEVIKWLLLLWVLISLNSVFPFTVHPWLIISGHIILISAMLCALYFAGRSAYRAVLPFLPAILGRAEKYTLSAAQALDDPPEEEGPPDEKNTLG